MITNVGTLDQIKKLVNTDPRIIIITFSANWCTPCQMLKPLLEQLEFSYRNRVLIINVDVERFPSVADAFKITTLPTQLFFFNKILWKNLTIGEADIGTTYNNVNILLTQHNDGLSPLPRSLIYSPPE